VVTYRGEVTSPGGESAVDEIAGLYGKSHPARKKNRRETL